MHLSHSWNYLVDILRIMRKVRDMRKPRTIHHPKDPQLKEWGEQIASRRLMLKMSQEELAALMEPPVAQSTVARWECGLTEPRRGHRQRLAEVLMTEAHILFPIRRAA